MKYAVHTLLARTGHAEQNYLRPYLGALGLSPGQPKILRCLYTNGPCSQKELAAYCEVDPSSVCRTLDSLEKMVFLYGVLQRQTAAPEKCLLQIREREHLRPGKASACFWKAVCFRDFPRKKKKSWLII